jgi:hypothetical protein
MIEAMENAPDAKGPPNAPLVLATWVRPVDGLSTVARDPRCKHQMGVRRIHRQSDMAANVRKPSRVTSHSD